MNRKYKKNNNFFINKYNKKRKKIFSFFANN